MTGTARVIRGNALALPLDDASVDLVVTSPPYFGLRSYQDGGEHYDGQIGDEATPAEFVDALLAATREMVRVVKPSGSIWVNLGDKYASSTTPGPQSQSTTMTGGRHKGVENVEPRRLHSGAPTKSLIGVPWRYALRCIDDLGLILRAEVIWSKPNGLPESVTDRVRRSHETWFHFTREPRYFSAVDEVREEHVTDPRTIARLQVRHSNPDGHYTASTNHGGHMTGEPHALGKLPGSVWTIPTQPLRVPDHLGVDHFAAFPMEWPRRIIRGWSPAGICVECGEGRRPVSESHITGDRGGRQFNPASGNVGVLGKEREYQITGYACACPEPTAPTTPATVLDPFGGTGTTALVARAWGRHGISVDMSADYCRLAEWRVNDPGELARAMQVEKPPKELPDQLDMFGGDAA